MQIIYLNNKNINQIIDINIYIYCHLHLFIDSTGTFECEMLCN